MQGKGALVTGGGSGIGRATARLLARRGARVAVADVNLETAGETAREIEAEGGEAFEIRADVADSADVTAMVERAVQELGRLDYACNIAGIAWRRIAMADYGEEDWDDLMRVNLRGMWLCVKQEITHMVAQGSGSVVNLASVLGKVAFGNASPFVAADHGVIGMTRAAAVEYADRGIRVNAVCPSFVNTDLHVRTGILTHPELREAVIQAHPMKRLGEVDEIAQAVVFLVSDAASFITGQALYVDGGYTAR